MNAMRRCMLAGIMALLPLAAGAQTVTDSPELYRGREGAL